MVFLSVVSYSPTVHHNTFIVRKCTVSTFINQTQIHFYGKLLITSFFYLFKDAFCKFQKTTSNSDLVNGLAVGLLSKTVLFNLLDTTCNPRKLSQSITYGFVSSTCRLELLTDTTCFYCIDICISFSLLMTNYLAIFLSF